MRSSTVYADWRWTLLPLSARHTDCCLYCHDESEPNKTWSITHDAKLIYSYQTTVPCNKIKLLQIFYTCYCGNLISSYFFLFRQSISFARKLYFKVLQEDPKSFLSWKEEWGNISDFLFQKPSYSETNSTLQAGKGELQTQSADQISDSATSA